MIIWLAVFVASVFLDFAWAVYTRHLVARNPGMASFWSAVIVILIGVNTISYTADPWLLLPAASGAYIGTYFATRR
jgi:hypothetical protein